MNRVKMNAKHEYEFIANFKVLQNIFRQHKIEMVCFHPLCALASSRHLAADSRREAREV